jgi:hypothetical protein
MKIGPDAPSTAENESGGAKHENMTRRLSTAENESESGKHESRTRRPRFCRKLVRERKT